MQITFHWGKGNTTYLTVGSIHVFGTYLLRGSFQSNRLAMLHISMLHTLCMEESLEDLHEYFHCHPGTEARLLPYSSQCRPCPYPSDKMLLCTLHPLWLSLRLSLKAGWLDCVKVSEHRRAAEGTIHLAPKLGGNSFTQVRWILMRRWPYKPYKVLRSTPWVW